MYLFKYEIKLYLKISMFDKKVTVTVGLLQWYANLNINQSFAVHYNHESLKM